MQKLFFEAPTQVRFLNGNDQWLGGIAYQDKLICGCCGVIIPLTLVKEEEIEVLRWQDISLAITD